MNLKFQEPVTPITESRPIPRVFISYSHDDEQHQTRVYAFADRLKQAGVKVIIDRDCPPGGPDIGWDKWSELQAEQAEIVLPVFTPSYEKCWKGEQLPGMRLGAIHELGVLYRRLYNAGSEINFCRILTFEDEHQNNIPTFLQGLPNFAAQRDFQQILAWLQLRGAAPTLTESQTQITWPNRNANYHWLLADRKAPCEAFQNMLTRNIPQRILLLEGQSNTGKTVLLNELLNCAKFMSLESILLDMKGCPSLAELFDNLTLDVSDSLLPRLHGASGSARKTALLQDLMQLQCPLLLGFDTYQQIAPDISDWIENQLLQRIDKLPGLIVLIAGQQVPDPKKFSWQGVASKHSLLAIAEKHYWQDYAVRVLGNQGISEQHIEMLLHVSKGEPGQTSALLQSFACPGMGT